MLLLHAQREYGSIRRSCTPHENARQSPNPESHVFEHGSWQGLGDTSVDDGSAGATDDDDDDDDDDVLVV